MPETIGPTVLLDGSDASGSKALFTAIMPVLNAGMCRVALAMAKESGEDFTLNLQGIPTPTTGDAVIMVTRWTVGGQGQPPEQTSHEIANQLLATLESHLAGPEAEAAAETDPEPIEAEPEPAAEPEPIDEDDDTPEDVPTVEA